MFSYSLSSFGGLCLVYESLIQFCIGSDPKHDHLSPRHPHFQTQSLSYEEEVISPRKQAGGDTT